MDTESLIAAYESRSPLVRAAVAGLSAAQLNRPVSPGAWSIQQVVVHLLDSDLAATHRMRRIAAEDVPLLIAYDETAFVSALQYERCDLGEVLDLFELNRRFTARWLRTLAPQAFDRAGVHNQRGKVTLREMVAGYIQHVDHHLQFVAGKRAALGGNIPAP